MKQLVIESSITLQDTKSIKNYLQDISKIQLLEPEEEIELTKEIKKGNQRALRKLVTSNLRFVVSVAKQYQKSGMPLEDLIEEGNIGLIKAAKKFDETKGFKFISYAVWWIRSQIQDAISNLSNTIRVPYHHTEAYNKLQREQNAHFAKTGYFKQDDDMIEELDMKVKSKKILDEVNQLRNMEYLDRKITSDSDNNIMELVPATNVEATDAITDEEDTNSTISQLMKGLDDRERLVIVNLFELEGHQHMNAKRLSEYLDVSVNTINIIKNKALKKLKSVAFNQNFQRFFT